MENITNINILLIKGEKIMMWFLVLLLIALITVMYGS
jgi:hypothetical protein